MYIRDRGTSVTVIILLAGLPLASLQLADMLAQLCDPRFTPTLIQRVRAAALFCHDMNVAVVQVQQPRRHNMTKGMTSETSGKKVPKKWMIFDRRAVECLQGFPEANARGCEVRLKTMELVSH